jgi:putative RecB family exonuclease
LLSALVPRGCEPGGVRRLLLSVLPAPQAEPALEIRILIKTKTPKIETHRYGARNDHHYRRLFAVVRAYLDDLDRGRFVFRPGLGCSMRDFRDTLCRSWDG